MINRSTRFLLLDPSFLSEDEGILIRSAILVFAVYKVMNFARYNPGCAPPVLCAMLKQTAKEGAYGHKIAIAALEKHWKSFIGNGTQNASSDTLIHIHDGLDCFADGNVDGD